MGKEKKNMVTIIGLVLYGVILIVSGYFLKDVKNGMAIFIIIMATGLLGLVVYHKKNTVYVCKSCGKKFELSVMKDLLSLHNSNTKYVRCPYCNTKAWHKEVE